MSRLLSPSSSVASIPVWRRFISLRHWRAGRTLHAAAFPDTSRRSFPTVTARRAPLSAARHPTEPCTPRALPGHFNASTSKTYSHETPRLPGLGPPFGSRPAPFLLPFPQRKPHPAATAREKDLLAEAGRVLQTSSSTIQRQPPQLRSPRAQRNRVRRRKPEAVEVTSPKLYVGNLSYDATESDLFELFNGVGSVQNAEVVTHKHNDKSKGFGFVTMMTIDEAKRAVIELHDKEFMGRKLVVSGAKTGERETNYRG